jgi:hypothetical protein
LTSCAIASRPSHYVVLYNKIGIDMEKWVIR